MADDDKTNPISEVVNEDWTFDVVRTYVLGAEAFDLNISATELRLLIMLRLRASGGRNNHVSNETLAKDLGVKKNAIAGYMTNLVEQGYVMCKSRGYGSPTLKTIRSMVTRYDDDILKMTRKDLFGSGRTDDLLDRLHHPTAGRRQSVDNASKNSGTQSRATDKSSSSSTRSDTMESRDRVTLEARDRVTEVDKEVNQNELDSTRSARDKSKFRKIGVTENGEKYDLDSGEVLDGLEPLVLPTQDLGEDEIRPETADPRDARLKFAADVEVQARARSDRAMRGQRKKLRERQAVDAQSGALEERKKRMEQDRLERLEQSRSGGRFYTWARNEHERFFPEIIMAPWTTKEFSQLAKLKEFYKDDEALIRRGWSYCCENWEHLQKKWKIAENAPSIGILLGFRERVFLVVQSQRTDRHVVERTFVKKKPGEW